MIFNGSMFNFNLSQLELKNFEHVLIIVSLDGVLTHRVISDRVHRLIVTLSYFRPDRFVQLLSLIPILILLLYLLVSIDLEYTGLLLLEKATKL